MQKSKRSVTHLVASVMILSTFLIVFSMPRTSCETQEVRTLNQELWAEGSLIPRPAVVNSIVANPVRPLIRLAGEWEFATDPEEVGVEEGWFQPDHPYPDQILVPGNWASQGVGGLGRLPDLGYPNARMVKGGYQGVAWQRIKVTIPAEWADKLIFLKFGGVMSNLALWVNGRFIGARYTGGAPGFQYEITDAVQPGEAAAIVAAIDSRLATPIRGDLENWAFFSGIFGHVELEAVDAVHLGHVFIIPDLANQQAVYRIRLQNSGPAAAETVVECAVTSLDGQEQYSASSKITIPAQGEAGLDVPVTMTSVRPWSPQDPNLYRAEVRLYAADTEEVIDGWASRFGMRTIESRDCRIWLNGKPIFLRGARFEGLFPVHISPPVDRAYYREALQRYKDFGFEYLRTPFLPPTEFWDMADEVGIMIQVAPCVSTFEYNRWLLEELIAERCNHPSLASYEMSNERYANPGDAVDLYYFAKQLDPTRLALDTDGAGGEPRPSCDLWVHYAKQPPGFTGYMRAISAVTPDYYQAPVAEHEYLNTATMPDLAMISHYTGGMFPPIDLTDLETWAKERDMLDEVLRYSWGADRQQTEFYKLGLETARKHPLKDGYSVYCGMDRDICAWPGVFNSMRLPKHRTAEEMREFNQESVLLANLPKREGGTDIIPDWTYYYGEPLTVELLVSNYSDRTPADAAVEWTLNDGSDVVLRGQLIIDSAPSYEVTTLGTVRFTAPEREEGRKLTLHVSLPALRIKNHWDLWFYPRRPRFDAGQARIGACQTLADKLADKYRLQPAPATTTPEQMPLIVTDRLGPYLDYLTAGGKVLLLGLEELPSVSPGYYAGGFASGNNSVAVLIEEHPAVSAFPNDEYGAWQIEKLMGQTVAYQDLRDQLVPIISSFIWPAQPYRASRVSPSVVAHLFETTVGKGKLLACGMKVLDATPEAEYLLDQLLGYAASDAFAPATEMPVDQLKRWSESST